MSFNVPLLHKFSGKATKAGQKWQSICTEVERGDCVWGGGCRSLESRRLIVNPLLVSPLMPLLSCPSLHAAYPFPQRPRRSQGWTHIRTLRHQPLARNPQDIAHGKHFSYHPLIPFNLTSLPQRTHKINLSFLSSPPHRPRKKSALQI